MNCTTIDVISKECLILTYANQSKKGKHGNQLVKSLVRLISIFLS